MRQVHAQHGIARLQQRKVNGKVCLCARMRLHIGMVCAKQFAGAGAGKLFHLIDKLAAAVIAVAGVTLGVFVGQNTAHCRKHCRGNYILRGNQLNIFALAIHFACHRGAYLFIPRPNKTDGIHHISKHCVSSSALLHLWRPAGHTLCKYRIYTNYTSSAHKRQGEYPCFILLPRHILFCRTACYNAFKLTFAGLYAACVHLLWRAR